MAQFTRRHRRLETRSGLRHEHVGFAASESLVEDSKMNYSANTDPELTDWLHWAEDTLDLPIFVRTIVEAAFFADLRHYPLLRPILLEVKRQWPRPVPTETSIRR
jgi:hypothetical protein